MQKVDLTKQRLGTKIGNKTIAKCPKCGKKGLKAFYPKGYYPASLEFWHRGYMNPLGGLTVESGDCCYVNFLEE